MTAMPTNAATETDTEGGAGPYNGREARNLAEKHRRDKLNASIQELAKMVPHVAESTRRLDKTAVLRFAAHGLRLQYVFGKSTRERHIRDDPIDTNEELSDKLMQLLDSFFITLTCHGQIVLISASVEKLLGHCQSDLYGQNILHITHPDDQDLLRQQLIPQNLESLFRNEFNQSHSTADDDEEEDDNDSDESPDISDYTYNTSSSPRDIANFEDVEKRLRADRRCFTVRLARAGARSEIARSYEIVKIDGCFRRSDCSVSAGGFPIVSQLIRRSRGNGSANIGCLLQHDAIAQAALHGISGNDIVLVAMARIIRPQKILNRLLEANQLEYRTRHLIDGRIIDCDQRIGLVAGYMKDEVRNLSPFSFMHQDDVRWVIVALRQMYDCNSDYGESCYRLLSRNGHFIYLQTKGYLEIDKSTNKVHSFVCVNTLLTEEEGQRRVQEMKKKFSIIINTKIPSNSLQDVPASQNPQQLERIVLYLIENLQKRNENATTEELAAASNLDNTRYSKTPPLALVPPEASSVKNSISKSVNVVNVTAAKNLQHNNRSPSSMQGSDASLSPASSVDQAEELIDGINSPTAAPPQPQPQRPTVLKINAMQMQPTTTSAADTKVLLIRTPSSSSSFAASLSPTSPTETATQQLQKQITVLKRLHSPPAASVTEESISPAKRTSAAATAKSTTSTSKEIHKVLSKSLQKLDTSLHTIDKGARSLSTQRSRLRATVPARSIDHQLDAIIVEQRKQKEILVNIKSEFDVHVQQQQPRVPSQPQQLLQGTTITVATIGTMTQASNAIPNGNSTTLNCKSEPL